MRGNPPHDYRWLRGLEVCMSRMCEGMTRQEWDSLPMTIGGKQVARVLCSNERYINRHYTDFGGKRIAGKYLYSKQYIADILGIDA